MYGWGESRRLSDRATTDRPALGCIGSVNDSASRELHMLWKGTVGDNRIFESRFIDGNWTSQGDPLPGISSLTGPALTEVEVPLDPTQLGLFMAWRGPDGDQQIYYATKETEAGGWSSQLPLGTATSSCRPSVANYGGVRVAWKGVEGDQRIWWSRLKPDGTWDMPHEVVGARTNDSPQLASFQNKLYLFWRDAVDLFICYTWLATEDAPEFEKPAQRVTAIKTLDASTTTTVTTTTGATLPGTEVTARQYVFTGSAIATTIRGDRLLLTWRDRGRTDQLYFTDFDGVTFSGPSRLHDFLSDMQADLYTLNGTTHMVCRGADEDRNIFWSDL